MRTAAFVAGSFTLVANAQNIVNAREQDWVCIGRCDLDDFECKQTCYQTVHDTSDNPLIAAEKCLHRCEQGNGSAAQTNEYHLCMQDCANHTNGISTILGDETTKTGSSDRTPPKPNSRVATASSSAIMLFTTIGTAVATETSVGASNTHSHPSVSAGAADALQVGMTGLELAGLVAGFIVWI